MNTSGARGSAPVNLKPLSLAGFNAAPQANHLLHEAWHPLPCSNICAIVSEKGGLHLIDASLSRCVWSWSRAELHGLATPLDAPQDGKTFPPHEDGDADANDGAFGHSGIELV